MLGLKIRRPTDWVSTDKDGAFVNCFKVITKTLQDCENTC